MLFAFCDGNKGVVGADWQRPDVSEWPRHKEVLEDSFLPWELFSFKVSFFRTVSKVCGVLSKYFLARPLST